MPTRFSIVNGFLAKVLYSTPFLTFTYKLYTDKRRPPPGRKVEKSNKNWDFVNLYNFPTSLDIRKCKN